MRRILFLTLFFPVLLSAQEKKLTLEDCLELALMDNVSVKNSHLDYMSAKMQRKEARSYYIPTVNFNYIGFRAMNPLVRIGLSDLLGSSDAANNIKYYLENAAKMNGVKTSYETLGNASGMSFVLTQPVYAGGRIVNGNRLASLGVQAAALKESMTQRDIASEIEKKYYLVVSLEEKMKVVEDGLAFAESLYKDVTWAYSAGLVTISEKEEVEVGRQDLKAKRIRLKGGIMLARMDLCNAVGLDCSDASSFTLSDRIDECASPENYYRDPASIIVSLEESQLLEMAVKQKQLEKKVAMGDALPQVGIGAMYSYGHIIGDPQSNGAVFATVKIPITEWSKTYSKMKNIDYQLQKAGNQRDYLCSMLELQLRQMWVEVESTWEELKLKEENAFHLRSVMEKTRADVLAGMATESQLLEKQLSLSNAECERIDARIAYREAVSKFLSRCNE